MAKGNQVSGLRRLAAKEDNKRPRVNKAPIDTESQDQENSPVPQPRPKGGKKIPAPTPEVDVRDDPPPPVPTRTVDQSGSSSHLPAATVAQPVASVIEKEEPAFVFLSYNDVKNLNPDQRAIYTDFLKYETAKLQLKAAELTTKAELSINTVAAKRALGDSDLDEEEDIPLKDNPYVRPAVLEQIKVNFCCYI
jgi:hypothetical protein